MTKETLIILLKQYKENKAKLKMQHKTKKVAKKYWAVKRY